MVVIGDNGYFVWFGEIVYVELIVEDDEIEFCGDGVNMIGFGIIKQFKVNILDVVCVVKV